MTNAHIINEIANDRLIEDIIEGITYSKFENPENLKDLSQDIYLQLLLMDNRKINELYSNKQLRYWITRILTNNIHSKTSPYYYQYKKNAQKSMSIDTINTDEKHKD